jgi:transcriptional regulator with XRE-family HTH domain
MSEAPMTAQKEASQEDLPLSVLLFNAAMSRGVALREFAEQLGINALSLRQFISGQTQRPRSRTLDVLAKMLDMPVEEVRRRASLLPTSAPSFADWLKTQMNEGNFSRARLTRETRISDGALRNYLSGQTLPDTDQAQRLSEVLQVEPLQLAKVLVAEQTVRAGGTTVEPEIPDEESGMFAGGDMASGLNGVEGQDEIGAYGAGGRGGAFHSSMGDEERLLFLWRQLHPQGRRATLNYIAALLAEG